MQFRRLANWPRLNGFRRNPSRISALESNSFTLPALEGISDFNFSFVATEKRSHGVIIQKPGKAGVETAADVFVTITPAKGDDLMLKWLRFYLPNFLLQFKVFAELSTLTNKQEIIVKASEILQSLNQRH